MAWDYPPDAWLRDLTRRRRAEARAGTLPRYVFDRVAPIIWKGWDPHLPAEVRQYHRGTVRYRYERQEDVPQFVVEAQLSRKSRHRAHQSNRKAKAAARRRWPQKIDRARALPHRQTRCDHSFWHTLDAQGGRCFLCGNPFVDDDWATEEHVTPKARGGAAGQRNVLLAHLGCNTYKADREPFPCEVLYLRAVNLMLGRDARRSWFAPLRARLAAHAAE